MTDDLDHLVERLRNPLWQHYNDGSVHLAKEATVTDLAAAADAIGWLRREVDDLSREGKDHELCG